MSPPESLGLGGRDQGIDQIPEHGSKQVQGQNGASLAIRRGGEASCGEACDVFERGLAMEDLDDQPVNDGDEIEPGIAPAMSGVATGGVDRFGIKMVSKVLPDLLGDSIDLVRHRRGLLVGLDRQAALSCQEALFFSSHFTVSG